MVVAAGAGSGKTYVLVERFMGLVRDGVAPDRLLTITFTEQAAREMKERIGHALAKEGVPDARRVAEACDDALVWPAFANEGDDRADFPGFEDDTRGASLEAHADLLARLLAPGDHLVGVGGEVLQIAGTLACLADQ